MSYVFAAPTYWVAFDDADVRDSFHFFYTFLRTPEDMQYIIDNSLEPKFEPQFGTSVPDDCTDLDCVGDCTERLAGFSGKLDTLTLDDWDHLNLASMNVSTLRLIDTTYARSILRRPLPPSLKRIVVRRRFYTEADPVIKVPPRAFKLLDRETTAAVKFEPDTWTPLTHTQHADYTQAAIHTLLVLSMRTRTFAGNSK